MATYQKPANLLSSVLYNPLQAAGADVSVSVGRIFFVGISEGIVLHDVSKFTHVVYSAGVAQVNNIDFAGVAVVNSAAYSITIQRLDDGTNKTYTIFTLPSGNTTSTIAAQFRTAVNNDTSRIVNATGATTHAILTEISTDTKGFILSSIPSGATNTATTAHTNPSGTYPEAYVYDPVKAAPAGQYDKYYFYYKKDANAAANSGAGHADVVSIIFANTLDAGYAAFNAEVLQIVSASNLADAAAIPYVAIS